MKLFANRIIPIAYWMDPVAALAAIVTMVACEIFVRRPANGPSLHPGHTGIGGLCGRSVCFFQARRSWVAEKSHHPQYVRRLLMFSQ